MRILPRRLVLLLTVLSLTGACATGGTPSSGARDAITYAELRESSATSVLDAVRKLRPQWRARISGVFLDGQAVSPAQLAQEPIAAVAEIRLLSAEQATARYGTRSLSGNYLDVIRRR